jgi:putative ABC transport system permease protein
MSWLDGLLHRLRTVLRPGAWSRELDEEIGLHLELDTLQGGDVELAGRRFGNRTWIREESRRMTWIGLLDAGWQDLRAAWRGVTRGPALTGLIVGTLALGLGVNAATFSLLDTLYLRPIPGVRDPGSLRAYWVKHFNTGDGTPFTSQALTYPMYRALAGSSGNPAGVALFTTDFGLRLGRAFGGPKLRGVYATANYFGVLGIEPVLGRLYTRAEDSMGHGAPVAVVSHSFWQRLGGGADVLGSTIEVGPESYTVIGVLPASFTGLDLQAADVWFPLAAMPAPTWLRGPWWESSYIYSFHAIERWRPGAAVHPVEDRGTWALRALERASSRRPDTLMTVLLGSALQSRGPGTPGTEHFIATRAGGVAAVVLVIAWANVINLLLARALTRRRELAVRLALGIPRVRLIRLLTLEAVLLSLLAAGAALALGWAGGSVLRSLLLPEVEWQSPPLDWRVAGFTFAIALGSGLLAGMVPALQSSRPALTEALKAGARGGGRRHSRLRSALVGLQAALVVTLLVGAGLFLESLRNVRSLDLGFDAGSLLFGSVEFEEGAEPAGPVMAQAAGEVERRLDRRPGIEAVARSSLAPMRGFSVMQFYSGADSAGSFPGAEATMMEVSPSFFQATGLELLRGQGFSAAEPGRREVVVNAAMARLFWPGLDPVGQCLRFGSRDSVCTPVVGVVENSRRSSIIEPEPKPQYYLPLGSGVSGSAGGTFIVRAAPGAGDAARRELLAELRQAFPAGYPTVRAMTQNLEQEYRPWRLGATLFAVFGLLALCVAVVGMYSAVSYDVRQRTHEFGIRVALGARIADLLALVVGEGVRTVALGVGLGIVLALAGGRLVAALLYGIGPRDPWILGGVSLTLLGVAALASLLPAWRAGRLDPVEALRDE